MDDRSIVMSLRVKTPNYQKQQNSDGSTVPEIWQLQPLDAAPCNEPLIFFSQGGEMFLGVVTECEVQDGNGNNITVRTWFGLDYEGCSFELEEDPEEILGWIPKPSSVRTPS